MLSDAWIVPLGKMTFLFPESLPTVSAETNGSRIAQPPSQGSDDVKVKHYQKQKGKKRDRMLVGGGCLRSEWISRGIIELSRRGEVDEGSESRRY